MRLKSGCLYLARDSLEPTSSLLQCNVKHSFANVPLRNIIEWIQVANINKWLLLLIIYRRTKCTFRHFDKWYFWVMRRSSKFGHLGGRTVELCGAAERWLTLHQRPPVIVTNPCKTFSCYTDGQSTFSISCNCESNHSRRYVFYKSLHKYMTHLLTVTGEVRQTFSMYNMSKLVKQVASDNSPTEESNRETVSASSSEPTTVLVSRPSSSRLDFSKLRSSPSLVSLNNCNNDTTSSTWIYMSCNAVQQNVTNTYITQLTS